MRCDPPPRRIQCASPAHSMRKQWETPKRPTQPHAAQQLDLYSPLSRPAPCVATLVYSRFSGLLTPLAPRSVPRRQVLPVQTLHDLDLRAQPLPGSLGQRHDAILVPLGLAHAQLAARHVDVFHTQPATLHDAQPRSVHQPGHQGVRGELADLVEEFHMEASRKGCPAKRALVSASQEYAASPTTRLASAG